MILAPAAFSPQFVVRTIRHADSGRGGAYVPGESSRDLPGRGLPHIGIVVDQKDRSSGRYPIVHNIGEGPKMDDVLFNWKITGHSRYFGPGMQQNRTTPKTTVRPVFSSLPFSFYGNRIGQAFNVARNPS